MQKYSTVYCILCVNYLLYSTACVQNTSFVFPDNRARLRGASIVRDRKKKTTQANYIQYCTVAVGQAGHLIASWLHAAAVGQAGHLIASWLHAAAEGQAGHLIASWLHD